VDELKREGFNLVPIEKADYLIACAFSDELAEDPRQRITINTPAAPPQTTGQILSQSEAFASVPGSRVSRPVVFRQRGIRLFR
jgi:PIN domain nuclease of toxin-antitoxin system